MYIYFLVLWKRITKCLQEHLGRKCRPRDCEIQSESRLNGEATVRQHKYHVPRVVIFVVFIPQEFVILAHNVHVSFISRASRVKKNETKSLHWVSLALSLVTTST